MTGKDANIAALIGSRICHDLISPIGAINNGLELLTMSGDPAGPEIGLIGESVDNASARIRFFRIAFGAAGDQQIGAAEVLSILEDLYGGGRLTVQWSINTPAQRAMVRLAFLAILCAETALPYGGTVAIKQTPRSWALRGTADRISLEPSLWELLSDPKKQPNLQPSQVQFGLFPQIALHMGRRITCQSDDNSLTLEF